MSNQPVTAAIVGCGHRGLGYGRYSLRHPEQLRIVAVADPNDIRRAAAAQEFAIPAEMQFRTAEELADGALLIADRGTVSGDYHYYRYAWGANPDEPLVMEAQVKVVSDGSFLIFSNGLAHERLGLWPDRIELYMHKDIRFDMDTTDDFHTYRVETEGADLRVYVDGELRLDAPGSFASGGQGLRQLAFGAANSGMVGEAYWKSVRARLVSQSCRDLVLSVDYP